MHPSQSDIGAYVKSVSGLPPLDNSAGTRQGSAVDVSTYQSLVLVGHVGAASGTPDSFTATYSVESSADGSSGWTAVSSGTALAADNGLVEINVNLASLTAGHAYVRAKEVIAFVNGTSPKIEGCAVFILAGGRTLPLT